MDCQILQRLACAEKCVVYSFLVQLGIMQRPCLCRNRLGALLGAVRIDNLCHAGGREALGLMGILRQDEAVQLN